MHSNSLTFKQTLQPRHLARVVINSLGSDFSDFYVYFAHIRLVEYDYWEQFESIQRLGEWCCQSGLVRESALQGVVLNAAPPHGNAPLVVGVLGPGYHSRSL